MKSKRQAIVSIINPVIEKLGFHYMEDNSENTPIVFAKRSKSDLYFLILVGRVMSGTESFSIEITLSPSTNAELKGRDIPDRCTRRLDKYIWTAEMLSKDSALTESIILAETEMLQDETMTKELKQSKKLLLEVQLENWVISWHRDKDESHLPLLGFIQFTPKEAAGGIDLKWFVVAEVILKVTWMPIDKDRVHSLATQAYWKYYLDSLISTKESNNHF